MLAILVAPLGMCLAQSDDPIAPPPPGGPRGPGFGQRQRPGPAPGPMAMLDMFDRVTKSLPEKLGLTADQLTKYNTLVQQQRAAIQEIVKKLEQQKIKFDTDLNAMLTPEQQTKLKELKKHREETMQRLRQGGPGMGGGQGMRGPGMMTKALEEMKLSPDKKAEVKKIIDDSQAKLQAAPKGDPQAHMQIMRDMREKIRGVLSPEEMDQLRSKMRQERGQWGPRGGGGRRGQGRGPDGPGNDQPPPPPAQEESLW